MKRTQWTAGAERDLGRAILWLDSVDPSAAVRISRQIVAKADWLADFATVGSPLSGGRRKLVVAGTNFVIVYRPRSFGISISRIHHSHQNWR